MAALYAWVPVSRGDPLPANAVKAGNTKTDGDVYVGRTHGSGTGFEKSVSQAIGVEVWDTHYEVGKVNLDKGAVWNLWTHHAGSSDKCEVLVTLNPKRCRVLWKDYRKGEALPEGFVYGGKTETDGHMVVGRTGDGVPGKLNLSTGTLDGVLHNLWVHPSGCHSEGQVLQVKPTPFRWVPIKRGDPLPMGAVLSTMEMPTYSDGDVYVGRNLDGEVGKINLDGGNFSNVWCHHSGGSQAGEILLLAGRVTIEWRDYKKGDPIPSEAVLGGHPSRDGAVYVAREKEAGVPGKLNVECKHSPPTAHNLWVQGHDKAHDEGQLLLIK